MTPRSSEPRDPSALSSADLLTVAEAAIFLQIHEKAVYRLLPRGIGGKIPGVGVRFRKGDLEDLVASGSHEK